MPREVEKTQNFGRTEQVRTLFPKEQGVTTKARPFLPATKQLKNKIILGEICIL